MLVLKRRIGESIIIDGNIKVSVLGLEGDRVKIGITAPREITIVREELLYSRTQTKEELEPEKKETEKKENELPVEEIQTAATDDSR